MQVVLIDFEPVVPSVIVAPLFIGRSIVIKFNYILSFLQLLDSKNISGTTGNTAFVRTPLASLSYGIATPRGRPRGP